MPNIKVTVGQQNAIKVLSSVASQVTVGSITDIDLTGLQDKYVLMYDATSQKWKPVPSAQVADLADNVDDDAVDYGTW